jgi:branched-chain amino acid aminotransferase
VPPAHFLRCVRLAVALNAEFVPPHRTGAAMYVRPLLFGASAQLGLNPPDAYAFVVYVLPVGVYHGVRPVAALVLEDFDRAAPCGTGAAKVGGNYAPVLPWSERAHARGFGITLHLDSKTRAEVDEFSTAAFIGVKKRAGDGSNGGGDGDEGYTVVMPDSKNVIKSVTADSCLQLARSFGWKVEVRPVRFSFFFFKSLLLLPLLLLILLPQFFSLTYFGHNLFFFSSSLSPLIIYLFRFIKTWINSF